MSSLQDVANELDNERWGAELNGEYHADVNALLATIKSLTEENEQLRNQASHESMGSFQHNSSQSEFAEYSGTNLREAFTRNAEQFDSLMVAMLAENEQLKQEVINVTHSLGMELAETKGDLRLLKANEKQLLENGRGYEERIRELQLDDYDKALMINALKAREMGYVELLLSTKERLIRYGKGGFVDPNCIAMDIGEALAQSPQQVEVYQAGQAVIDAAIDWWKYDQIAAELLEAVGKLQATIDKADKGE